MKLNRYTPEEILGKLCDAEASLLQEKNVGENSREREIADQTYY